MEGITAHGRMVGIRWPAKVHSNPNCAMIILSMTMLKKTQWLSSYLSEQKENNTPDIWKDVFQELLFNSSKYIYPRTQDLPSLFYFYYGIHYLRQWRRLRAFLVLPGCFFVWIGLVYLNDAYTTRKKPFSLKTIILDNICTGDWRWQTETTSFAA